MNCLEFRRTLLENPAEESNQFMDHLASCDNCAKEYNRAQEFEATLKEALLIDTPDNLSERILLSQQMQKKRSIVSKPWMAIAASIALFSASIFFAFNTTHINNELGQTALHHILDERPHLHESNNVSTQKLAELVGDMGGQLTASLGQVNFAGRCQIRKYKGLHLVLSGEKGAVTVLLMPKEYSEAEHIQGERFQGSLIPTSYGSMAVIGEQGEDTIRIGKRVMNALSWQA